MDSSTLSIFGFKKKKKKPGNTVNNGENKSSGLLQDFVDLTGHEPLDALLSLLWAAIHCSEIFL